MNLIERMPDLRDCFLLTPGGSLGVYQQDGSFRVDGKLTQALAAPIAAFLENYRRRQDTRDYRIGLVHSDHTGQPWQSLTLALEDQALLRLYPTANNRHGRLTAFQRRNREKSLYRGMELLLDYRDQVASSVPFFCPVFVYRGTTLDRYLPWVEREWRDSDAHTPVVEVIDLFAGVPLARHADPAIAAMLATQRKLLVKPERRSAPNLVLIDDVRHSSYAWKENASTPADPYAEAEERAIAEISGRFAATGFRDWNYSQCLESHCTPQTGARLNQWLRANGYQYRQADELRCFERMAELDRAALSIIATRNPVFRVPAGTRLLDRGSRDNWNLYLLSGDLELSSEHDSGWVLTGGSPSARKPVAFLKPRLFSVTARSTVEFLWLYEPMVEAVARLHQRDFSVQTTYVASAAS